MMAGTSYGPNMKGLPDSAKHGSYKVFLRNYQDYFGNGEGKGNTSNEENSDRFRS